jgi:predicted site-specific integrase-resolvase
MYRPDPRYLTSAQAAAQLGISRRTLYRWMHEGRIDALLTPETIANVHKRPRGPKRNPRSKRYTIGRHTFTKASGPNL